MLLTFLLCGGGDLFLSILWSLMLLNTSVWLWSSWWMFCIVLWRWNMLQKSCWWGVIPSWPLLWSPPWLFRSTSQWCTPATLSAATIFWMLFRLIWGFLWRFSSQALLQFSPWLTSPEISPFNFPLTYSEISPESYCLTPTWNFLLTRPEIFLLTCFLNCPVGCESSLLVLMMEVCSIGLEQIQRRIQLVAHVLK